MNYKSVFISYKNLISYLSKKLLVQNNDLSFFRRQIPQKSKNSIKIILPFIYFSDLRHQIFSKHFLNCFKTFTDKTLVKKKRLFEINITILS